MQYATELPIFSPWGDSDVFMQYETELPIFSPWGDSDVFMQYETELPIFSPWGDSDIFMQYETETELPVKSHLDKIVQTTYSLIVCLTTLSLSQIIYCRRVGCEVNTELVSLPKEAMVL
jgi:hypothetical protein